LFAATWNYLVSLHYSILIMRHSKKQLIQFQSHVAFNVCEFNC